MEPNIGKLLKTLRAGKKMTLKQIAEKTGLSISFLSQVERSKSSVTLESLKKISDALGVSPSTFFPSEQQPSLNNKLRRATGQDPFGGSFPFVFEDLSGDLESPLLLPILVTLQPHEEKGEPFAHEGQEFVYVLEGVLTLLLGEEEYELYPGDSIHMESSTPHTWLNRTGKRVRILCVNSSPLV